jgi:hypothetical protein
MATSYLLGNRSSSGWWYYFPVAFLFKTSAGLHILMLLAAAGFAIAIRDRPSALLTTRLRGPAVAVLVFGALLLRAKLNIGFRYALPVLPFIAILTAAGVARMWAAGNPRVRMVSVAAATWMVIFSLSYYPFFLTFVSEYGPDRDENYKIFADSSLDWGQGLIALRDFLQEHGIDGVYLSYFGSARPAAYGIAYTPLVSFYPLPTPPSARTPVAPPEWVVISATNLTSTYFVGDPFVRFRNVRPDFVVGHTMFIYRLDQEKSGARQ